MTKRKYKNLVWTPDKDAVILEFVRAMREKHGAVDFKLLRENPLGKTDLSIYQRLRKIGYSETIVGSSSAYKVYEPTWEHMSENRVREEIRKIDLKAYFHKNGQRVNYAA